MTKKKPTQAKAAAAETVRSKPAKGASGRIKPASEPKETKSAIMLRLLQQPQGATLEQMMDATGWQKHSVRGFLAGALKKRQGLTAISEKAGGGRIYRSAPAEAQP